MMSDKIDGMRTAAREKLNDWQDRLQRAVGVRDSLLQKKNELEKEKNNSRKKAIKATEALNFVEESVKTIRDRTLRSIESVTNEALQVVYSEESIKLECGVSIKRDRSAITLRYLKYLDDGTVIRRVPSGSGCGVSDVVAFALRMVLIKATGCEPILIADEPFKWLGRNQIPHAAKLLKYLAEKLNVQIVLTSHHPDLRDAADIAYQLELDENSITRIVSETIKGEE